MSETPDSDASLLDRLTSQVTLRRSERVAHLASAVAVVLTIMMVSAAAAREVNPVSAWLIGHLDVTTWALATPLAVAVVFAGLRVLQRVNGDGPLARLVAGGRRVLSVLVPSALVLDAAGNVLGFAVSGVPSVWWAGYSASILGVSALALVLAFRWELRAVVPSLPDVDTQRVAPVVFAALVVVSGFVAVVAVDSPSSPVQNASATHGGPELMWVTQSDDLKYQDHNGNTDDTTVGGDFPGKPKDFDDDGNLEIPYDTNSGQLNFTQVDGTQTSTSISTSIVGGSGDIDGDGDPDVLIMDGSSNAKYADINGNVVDTGIDGVDVGGVADIDGDGLLEMAVLTGTGVIKMVDKNGEVVNIDGGGSRVGGIGDIDGDGDLDVTHTGGNTVSFVDINNNTVDTGAAADLDLGGVGDLDGDGDLDIVHLDTSNNLKYVDASGNVVDTGNSGYYAGYVADLDEDSTYTVSGTVNDTNGNPISGAEVTDGNGNTTTTDSNGQWNISGYPDGTYSFTASASGYISKTKNVTVSNSDATLDFNLTEESTSGYTHTFVLEDNTGQFPDPTLTVEQYAGTDISAIDGSSGTAITSDDWTAVEETTFNHDDEAYVEMEETARHRLTLTDGDATYQEIGFRPSEKPNPYNLTIGTPGTPTPTANATATPTANTSGEACAFTEADDGDYELACIFDDEVTSYEFNLSAPNGSYYEGSLDFDEPTSYYEGEFDSNFTENLTDGESVDPEDLAIDYSGTYANGSSFNGTTSLFGTSDDGGGFSFGGGPTGKSGGGSSGLQQAGGIALLAGAAILGYRRFSDQSLTQAASGAAGTAASAGQRVASAASSAVGRLRGGGRG